MAKTKAGGSGDDPSLIPLRKTLTAIKEIRTALLPFLSLLADSDAENGAGPSSGTKRSRANSSQSTATTANSSSSTIPTLDPSRRAEAEAAAAMAIGTLRYMAARLKGQDRGRKKGDPLRVELDNIRGTIVALRRLENGGAKETKSSSAATTATSGEKKPVSKTTKRRTSGEQQNPDKGAKRRSAVDMDAGGRMIKAALAGDTPKDGSGAESAPSSKKSRKR